jgi:hypothetical protein
MPTDIRAEQHTEAVQQQELMQSLIEHPGWKMLCDNMDARIEEKTNLLDEPLESLDKVGLLENVKGERRSLRFIKMLPDLILTQAVEVIAAIVQEAEDESNDKDEPKPDSEDGDDGDN